MGGLQKLNQLLNARFLVSSGEGEADRFIVEQLGQVHELPEVPWARFRLRRVERDPGNASRHATVGPLGASSGKCLGADLSARGDRFELLGALEAERCFVVLPSARADGVARPNSPLRIACASGFCTRCSMTRRGASRRTGS
jgi:hypothetical protein